MINNTNVFEVLALVKRHNALYRMGTPEVDDATYDTEVEQLRSLDPENEWFKQAEPSPVSNSRKRKLPIPMRSLEKVKDMADIENWIRSCGLSDEDYIVIQPKFDGLSMLVDESVASAYTRGGDENEGQDCSDHYILSRSYFRNGDSRYRYTFGEYIISNKDWEEHFKGKLQENGNPYKSQRNTAAGLLNRDIAGEMVKYCTFVRYGADYESMVKHYDRFADFMGDIFHRAAIVCNDDLFENVVTKVGDLKKNGKHLLMLMFEGWSKKSPMDGLVLYVDDLKKWPVLGRKENGNPNYAIAFKDPEMTASYTTTVRRIEWQISKAGYMKPVVIVDDVDNGDCIMNSPTGYNARYIFEHGIASDAEVLLTRSGGVIPKILDVLEPAPDEEMDRMKSSLSVCPHCGGELKMNDSGVELMCTNPQCPGIRLAKCVFFYDTMKSENIGPAVVKAMFDSGLDSVDLMIHATADRLYRIEGFGDGIVNYILEANRKILSGVELPVLMHASDCFEGLGQVKLQAMLNKYPNVEDIFMQGGWVEAGPDEGMSKTEAAFMVGLNAFSDFFYDTCIPIRAHEAKVVSGDKCVGWSVCFSGVRDSELEKQIEENGGKIASGVSKNTTHLVVKDVNATSSKIEKAKKLGVTIVSIELFKEKWQDSQIL